MCGVQFINMECVPALFKHGLIVELQVLTAGSGIQTPATVLSVITYVITKFVTCVTETETENCYTH
jgi:hypothetical protein